MYSLLRGPLSNFTYPNLSRGRTNYHGRRHETISLMMPMRLRPNLRMNPRQYIIYEAVHRS